MTNTILLTMIVRGLQKGLITLEEAQQRINESRDKETIEEFAALLVKLNFKA